MPVTSKTELRSRMRKLRRELSPETQRQHAAAFCNNVLKTRHYRRADSLACYMPVFGELDTRPLMRHALDSGRRVFLPVIDGRSMWFSRWFGEELPVNRASRLVQPARRAQRLLNLRTLDLVIVPLVAFTANGTRLGQGGGYYDKTFASHRHQRWRRPRLFGAAHEQQRIDNIPDDPWDVPLSGIITNLNTILCN